jgi:hypothetical protein
VLGCMLIATKVVMSDTNEFKPVPVLFAFTSFVPDT